MEKRRVRLNRYSSKQICSVSMLVRTQPAGARRRECAFPRAAGTFARRCPKMLGPAHEQYRIGGGNDEGRCIGTTTGLLASVGAGGCVARFLVRCSGISSCFSPSSSLSPSFPTSNSSSGGYLDGPALLVLPLVAPSLL
jgi:hypothetical protein